MMEGFTAAVKKIVDVQVTIDGTKYFRVCWKDTWEPELHLLSCKKLLEEFWNSREQKIDVKDGSSNGKSKEAIDMDSENTNLPLIQCEDINTTSNKHTSLRSPNLVSPKLNLPISKPNPRTCCKGTQCSLCCGNKEILSNDCPNEIKTTKDVGIQYELVSQYSFDSECILKDDRDTRDIACQCEPNVRHFAVQKQTVVEEKPEVAEISVQVSPDICSTSTQCSFNQKRKLLNLERDSTQLHPMKKMYTPSSIVSNTCTSLQNKNSPRKIGSFETPTFNDPLPSKNSVIDIPQNNLCEKNADEAMITNDTVNTEHTTGVEIAQQTVSQNVVQLPVQQPFLNMQNELVPVPSINPNQLFQASTLPVSQLVDWNTSNLTVTTKPDVLKEMLFVVNENITSEQSLQTQPIFVLGNNQIDNCEMQTDQNMVGKTSKIDTKSVSTRTRRKTRKNSEQKQEEQADNISVCAIFNNVSDKIVYSRSLFPTGAQATNQTISTDDNKQKAHPIKARKKNCVDSPTTLTRKMSVNNSPVTVSCSLNESNVSTVYDLSPTCSKLDSPTHTKVTKDQSSNKVTRTCSLSREDTSINDNFISKYWK